MKPDLLRQRRNLIAISVVLLIFDFAQVEIAKVSVLGTELLIGNAQVLMAVAWILWGYFLLRYYQYWRAEPEQLISAVYQKRLDAYVRAYLKPKVIIDLRGRQFDDYKICRVGFNWVYKLQDYDPSTSIFEVRHTSRLPYWRLAIWVLKSAIFVCLKTPHATDRILPFVLAFLALVITLFTHYCT